MLASASPRRARILRSLGVSFRVLVSHEDESLRPGEDGAAAVERLARAKALAVAREEMLPVLAADTEVLCDGHVLGKPADDDFRLARFRHAAPIDLVEIGREKAEAMGRVTEEIAVEQHVGDVSRDVRPHPGALEQ